MKLREKLKPTNLQPLDKETEEIFKAIESNKQAIAILEELNKQLHKLIDGEES